MNVPQLHVLTTLAIAQAQEIFVTNEQEILRDYVLVNSDPVRQDRILDVLGAQADRLQILILTCHPDRYRGVGQPTTITAAS